MFQLKYDLQDSVDLYYEPCCHKCEKNEDSKIDASQYLQEVIEQIYNTKELDTGTLEHSLDELCYFFGIEIIQNAFGPQIKRTPKYV